VPPCKCSVFLMSWHGWHRWFPAPGNFQTAAAIVAFGSENEGVRERGVSKGGSCETRQQAVPWSPASDVFVLVFLYCKVSRKTLQTASVLVSRPPSHPQGQINSPPPSIYAISTVFCEAQGTPVHMCGDYTRGPIGAQRRGAQAAGQAEKQRSVPFSVHCEIAKTNF